MSDFQVSRRNLIAAAAVGVTLAGCKEEPFVPPLVAKAWDPPYGDDPNLPAPSGYGKLKPNAITLVRISSGSDFGVSVNYGTLVRDDISKEFPPEFSDRESIAQHWFSKLIDNSNPNNPNARYQFSDPNISDEPGRNEYLFNYPTSATTYSRGLNDFEHFGWNKKSEIYFWIDSDNIDFLEHKGSSPIKYQLVSMSELLLDGKTKASKNKSFYARKIPLGGLPRGIIISVTNYCLDGNGNNAANQNPQGKTAVHSMNIYFKAKIQNHPSGKPMWVPMVIDPDTGNGYGYNP